MKHYAKIAVIYLLRILLHILYIFPVKKNRILFSSFEGGNYGCSPKYIFEYMYKNYGNSYEYVWCINDINKIPKKYKVLSCCYLTFLHLFYLLTSRVIISNQPIVPIVPKKKEQLFINTCHGGGAYKKGGVNASFVSKPDKLCMTYMKNLRAGMTNYVISSCHAYTDIFSTEIEYNIDKSRFIQIGMPRNDLFFASRKGELRKKICSQLNIDEEKKIILYAPTYRGSYRKTTHISIDMNVQSLCETVKQRFGESPIMLYRHHIADKGVILEGVVDVSDYQDMQELLFITDIFITDYSSSVWDYSLTGKPGFLFTPDLHEYQTETDFHTPIELWPYPYALTTEELCANILKYDATEALQKIKAHHSLLGSYEKGTATEEICKVIKNHLISK